MGRKDVVPATDVAPAHWLIQEVTGFSGRVRDVVPARYDAFARVVSVAHPMPLRRLCAVLGCHSQTDRCWFALWDGWPAADAWHGAPTFHLPHRDYLLFSGSLYDDLMIFAGDDRGPSLWWPEDRAWVVASEVDSDSLYVAGSRPLIDDLLRADGLTVIEVGPDAAISVDE